MTAKFPSIPDPSTDPASMLATILALRDVVRQLVKAQDDVAAIPLSTYRAAKVSVGGSATVSVIPIVKSDAFIFAQWLGPPEAAGSDGVLTLTLDGILYASSSIATVGGRAVPTSLVANVPELTPGIHTFTVASSIGLHNFALSVLGLMR